MTPLVELPATATSFLLEAGLDVGPAPSGDGVLVYDSENGLIIRRDAETFVVEDFSRGHVGRVLLRTEERAAVSRYVVLWSGPAWRNRAGLPFLYTMRDPAQVPDGYEVRQSSPRRFTLLWSQDGRGCRAEDLDTGHVTALARALPHSLGDVVASLKAPGGWPVFPQVVR
ncbi:hypothetical protein [Cellulomonas sp. P5_C5]